MKICFLADAQSAHTQRWVQAVQDKGHKVIIISFRPANIPGVRVFHLQTPRLIPIEPSAPFWSRFHYLFAAGRAQELVDEFNPDILHAFYATSYGYLGARLKAKKFFISVWGQDVTKSQNQWVMRFLVRYSLKRAEKIFCTSKYLMGETSKFKPAPEKIIHLPFGIDTERFKPNGRERSTDTITLGCIKPLESIYGIETLLEAFRIAHSKNPKLKLILIKTGHLLVKTQTFVEQNSLEACITLVDPVEHKKVPHLLNQLDILVIPSLVESFGVAALEGSACQLPIIATTVGGIPEVVLHQKTGLLVPPQDVNALTQAICELSDHGDLRIKYGTSGREFVMREYEWEKNVDALVLEYRASNLQRWSFKVP